MNSEGHFQEALRRINLQDKLYQKRLKILQEIFYSRKVSHAYLFTGKLNQENLSLIYLLAKTLLCLAPGQRPCGNCRSCMLISTGNHPDFRVIEPEGDKIKLEQVREICYDTALSPYLSEHKVYFFKKFEQLTEVAANAFLKTLEEPPPAVCFLAIAESEIGLPATVLSRMQRVYLGSSQEKDHSLPSNTALQILTKKELLPMFKKAEIFSTKDRSEIDLYLCEMQEKYRSFLEFTVEQGEPLNLGLVNTVEAIRKAREYLAANLNIRLLLEDLYLTVYEELST